LIFKRLRCFSFFRGAAEATKKRERPCYRCLFEFATKIPATKNVIFKLFRCFMCLNAKSDSEYELVGLVDYDEEAVALVKYGWGTEV